MSGNGAKGEAAISHEEIRAQLARLVAAFGGAERQKAFLSFTVSKVLEGLGAEIKEYVIAQEVYQRDSSYDPKVDSIVRVEAARVRSRLRDYYEGPGKLDPIVVEFPKGSYVPVFRRMVLDTPAPAEVSTEPAPVSAPPDPASRRSWPWPAGIAAAAAIAAGVWYGWRPAARIEPQTVSVLPFVNLAAGSSPEAPTAAAKHLEVSLTRSARLRVIPRGSGPSVRPRFVLEGTLQGDSRQLRLLVQLLDARDGGYVWSGKFDATPPDSLWTKDSITEAIAQETTNQIARYLEAQSAPGSARAKALTLYREANTRPSYDGDSLMSRGPSNITLMPLADLNRSISLLEQSVAADPQFALAHAALADYYQAAAEYDPAILVKARQSGKRAIELDSRLAEAHYTLGFIYLLADWDVPAAAKAFQSCLDSQPRTLSAHRLLADSLSILGRHEDALQAIERARAVYPDHPVIETEAASVLYHSRRFAEMETLARRSLKRFPDFHLGHWSLALALEQLGRRTEAISEAEQCLALSPRDSRCTAALGHLYAVAGKRDQARRILGEYRSRPGNMSKATYVQAMIHAGLGEWEPALDNLETAVATREFDVPYMRVEPRLDLLRAHPRFHALLRKAGFAD